MLVLLLFFFSSCYFCTLVLWFCLVLFGSVWFFGSPSRLLSGVKPFVSCSFGSARPKKQRQKKPDILCAELLVKRPPAAAARTIKNLHITPRPLFYSAHNERTAGNSSCEHEKPPQIINQTQLLSVKQKRDTKSSHVYYY